LEYQTIETADDSDDEKKIRSAENRTLKHKIQGQNKRFHSNSNYKEIQWQQQARQHDLLHSGFLLLFQLFYHFHTNSRPFVTGPLGANHNRATFATTVLENKRPTKKQPRTSMISVLIILVVQHLLTRLIIFRKMIKKYW
jgi:hypothetical protein